VLCCVYFSSYPSMKSFFFLSFSLIIFPNCINRAYSVMVHNGGAVDDLMTATKEATAGSE
jgi:hypothetical protein